MIVPVVPIQVEFSTRLSWKNFNVISLWWMESWLLVLQKQHGSALHST